MRCLYVHFFSFSAILRPICTKISSLLIADASLVEVCAVVEQADEPVILCHVA